MILTSLLEIVDIFYKEATLLADRDVSDKTVYVYKIHGQNNIDIMGSNGTIRCTTSVGKYPGSIVNDSVDSSELYQLYSIASNGPLDALLSIILVWKLFGPIVPDDSLSASAKNLINNYYNKNKDNPNLIQPIVDWAPPNPFKSIYFPNPAYLSMANSLNIINVTDPETISKLDMGGSDLFESKYNK